ncbi:MAG TPA: CaiB/BaiF CoA-transferase family protein [Candidatus Binataceae bacterium]|nr:CaiB/BaiF CoA-transferase family protein [Candidatus Binataceae bacterium]
MSEAGALNGLRVLDLTGYRAHLCGRLMADMGADVIKTEPPGGDPGRRVGPFVDDRPHPDRSLFFWFYNLNKRSLTLDLARPQGAEILMELAKSADLVIESFKPGRMREMGLGWEVLSQVNPALILLSIAPFGQTGPYRDFEADDTVLAALSGMLYVNGSPRNQPVRPLGLQAYHSSAYYAAIGAMCALFARDRDGSGQWIDLSMQEGAAAAVEHVAGSFFGEGRVEPRRGTLHWSRYFRVGRCRDGYVMHCTLGDWTSLVEWVAGDGKARDLTAPEWNDVLYRGLNAEHLFDVLDDWVKDYKRDELLERAQMLRLPYATVRNPEALLDDEQLAARGYFAEVEHPELGRRFRYPGAPYLFNGTPWRVYRRPPLIGEHTGEILRDELGFEPDRLAALAAEGII